MPKILVCLFPQGFLLPCRHGAERSHLSKQGLLFCGGSTLRVRNSDNDSSRTQFVLTGSHLITLEITWEKFYSKYTLACVTGLCVLAGGGGGGRKILHKREIMKLTVVSSVKEAVLRAVIEQHAPSPLGMVAVLYAVALGVDRTRVVGALLKLHHDALPKGGPSVWVKE